MEIYNTDTNKTEEITYLCHGQDMFSEIADDDDIEWNGDKERMEAPEKTIRWWADYVDRLIRADDLENEAKKVLDWTQKEKLNEDIARSNTGDFERDIETRVKTIREFMTEAGFVRMPMNLDGVCLGHYFEERNNQSRF